MIDEPEADLFEDDPITEPLTYPGRIPGASGILIDDTFLPLQAVPGKDLGHWEVSSMSLAGLIGQLGSSPLSARVPVVAVGSNASPSQLLRKFASRSVRPVIPMTLADVTGLIPGVSAHVSKPGYIPAAPVKVSGEVSHLFVLWLDDTQLHTLDETEPNYRRCSLSPGSFRVRIASGAVLPNCFLYVGKHGCLVDSAGRPKRLGDQRSLIRELLDESARLRELCGETPEDFAARMRDPAARETVQQVFALEGKVLVQPGLIPLPSR